MISVIVPLMAIPPYDSQVVDFLKSIEQQTATHEVILVEQEPGRYIDKNKLLNEGLSKARGNIIWHCDADFLLPDKTLLQRMQNKLKDVDVIYPMFWSKPYNGYKIADGAPFMKRDVLKRYGRLDESLRGIGYVTFPFLLWCLTNTEVYCSPEFKITINDKPFVKRGGKGHVHTMKKLKPLADKLKKQLREMGLWP